MEKTIKIDKETHKLLLVRKADGNFKNINDVIKSMIKENEQ